MDWYCLRWSPHQEGDQSEIEHISFCDKCTHILYNLAAQRYRELHDLPRLWRLDVLVPLVHREAAH
jgi:hypothetical protein